MPPLQLAHTATRQEDRARGHACRDDLRAAGVKLALHVFKDVRLDDRRDRNLDDLIGGLFLSRL